MCKGCVNVSLGFAEDEVPVGTHMCLIYTDETERAESLLSFLLTGLQTGERSACFSGNVTEEDIRAFLQENGISYDERKQERAISYSTTSDVYFQDGTFDPERMLGLLEAFYHETENIGFPRARVIGEMSPEVESVPGGDRLLEYESRVSMLLRDYPITTVCQYDANEFDGATIMEVLKVHPQMLVNGAVVKNPFYIEPEVYLERLSRGA